MAPVVKWDNINDIESIIDGGIMRIAIAMVFGLVIGSGQSAYPKYNPLLIRALRISSNPKSFGLGCFHLFSIQRTRAENLKDLRWKLQMRSQRAWASEKS